MATGRICILVHEISEGIAETKYLIKFLASRWENQGVEVICARGPQEAVDADVALLHVDSTRIEPAYLECMARYPVALNARVADISKTTFSQLIVGREDDYSGKVIVKTKANYGGIADAVLDYKRGAAQMPPTLVERPWRRRQVLDPVAYPVFDSLAEVPSGVWRNDSLIVEKFVAERDSEGNYRLRVWFFLGEREICELDTSTQPVVKGKKTFRRELISDVPQELRAIRARLGFDYGKFDFALVDGEPVLYDINRTPTVAVTSRELFGNAELDKLARGINAFFDVV